MNSFKSVHTKALKRLIDFIELSSYLLTMPMYLLFSLSTGICGKVVWEQN